MYITKQLHAPFIRVAALGDDEIILLQSSPELNAKYLNVAVRTTWQWAIYQTISALEIENSTLHWIPGFSATQDKS
eukprot:IDg20137t1